MTESLMQISNVKIKTLCNNIDRWHRFFEQQQKNYIDRFRKKVLKLDEDKPQSIFSLTGNQGHAIMSF